MKRTLSTSKANPLRSFARRAWRATSSRADVRVEQLARQVAVLENLVGIPERIIDVQPRILAALTPIQDEQLELERIGSEFDGGYVLSKQLIECASGLVSIGIGDNNDADLTLAERGLRVHAWDHTIGNLPRDHALITFHRIGVGATDATNIRTLTSITDMSFGEDINNLLLLMDVEGHEWEVLSAVSDTTLNRYSMLGLEFHNLGDALLLESVVLDVLERLRRHFTPVVVHPNNHGTLWASEGFVLPDMLEVTYVRSDLVSTFSRPGDCPGNLLSPCCPDLPEMILDWVGRDF